ncbi:rod shape-determining protein MreC [Flavicella sp.]|uniref:rod shape-determining protein MreC n=1 Tax=Flavicella sp. TaxID=2957742 RepID=UPI0026333D01|nr:rod shape-determining protein MreC [Flavicella sp.]MDG1803576.1 rod shape-determining protein MreC [Flavicella sp.]MDG2279980.1 rod shape-determining protein MreC [Flavicella sp.]
MQQIAYFIEKYKYFLLFLLLEIIAIGFTIQSHSYHKSQFFNSANAISGGLLEKSTSIFEYGVLKKDNQRLAEENARLRSLVSSDSLHSENIDSLSIENKYISAKVIQNSYTKRNNILTLNKGRLDGVAIDMGIVNNTGIIGVVNKVSNNYATVLSVLNSNSKINARLKKNNYFGTLTWNGQNYRYSQLLDIQRQADIRIGDTIVSGGKSILFPDNTPIGIIRSFDATNKSYDNIEVELFMDMSNIGYVYAIQNIDKEEILELQKND